MAFPTGYTLYDQLVIDGSKVGGSSGTLTDYVVYVSGADLSSQFWSTVRTDGGDIRATLNDGTTQIPVEVVFIDTSGHTAEIHVKCSPDKSTGLTIRLWYNGTDTQVAANSTYGSQNVWTKYSAVYHLNEAVNNSAGGYLDSTANAFHATGTSMSLTAPTGKLAGKCQDFDGTADYINTNKIVSDLMSASAGYISAWCNSDAAFYSHALPYRGNCVVGDKTGRYLGIYGHTDSGNKLTIYNYEGGEDNVSTVVSSSTWYHAVWRHSGGTLNASVNGSTGSTASGNTDAVTDAFCIAYAGDPPNGQFFDGKIDEVRFSASDLGADWVTTEFNNQSDSATFYAVTAMPASSGQPTSKRFGGLNHNALTRRGFW